MNNLLLKQILEVQELKQALDYKKKAQACILTGLAGSSKPAFFAALDAGLGEQSSLVILLASREELRAYRRELNYFYPNLPMQELYPVGLPKVKVDTQSLEVQAGRAAALRFMQGKERGIVFVTAEALQQKQLRPSSVAAKLRLSVGESVEQGQIIRTLADLGYERTMQVDALGQFSVRGEILDIYPINCAAPIRIEWFDTDIDAMRSFNLENQRSIENLEAVEIAPLVVEQSAIEDATLFDYLAPETLVWMDEPVRLVTLLERLEKENKDYAKDLVPKEEILELCAAKGVQLVSALGHKYLAELPSLNIPVRGGVSYNKNFNVFTEDLGNWLRDGATPVVMLTNSIKARALADNLKNYRLKAKYVEQVLVPGVVNVMFGELDHGFRFWSEDWVLITENDIYGMQKLKRIKHKGQGQQLQYFSDIKAGDYVVHRIHGIGRYMGVETISLNDTHKDYLLICYAGEDKLYVPVDQVSLLHKYVGSEGATPRLSKMGGSDWKKTTAKAAKAITELAEELLRLYAQRKIVEGHAFAPDNDYQRQFEEAFPFEETQDQLKAIKEIKEDMEKPQPMDRLLCGDVGYGKTEVALRAAFKAVMDGKQVAVMVPTTVLAQQHFLTFKERLKNFGVNVELLNRFVAAKEQREILKNLSEGLVDIVIGTHRLLGQDIQFYDLGLLIIDEEQRFGVAQKEKIKKWCTGIDVLCLSATPIPRTLHLALVNGRDMSVIESPPEDRLPVETYVSEYDDGLIKEAIERELRRGGRVYYIHNRVEGLEKIATNLRKLVPGISIKIGHGQMDERLLEDAMISFYEGDCDVLLCTTIVENGLDVPLANTIIIDGAENFGLSQLYQMRGRVGRSSRLAYAYLVYRPNKLLSEVAEKRLQAIRDFTELGAGFKIAMRDLEIRGAGNLLGREQHGHIAGIGFAAYCEMLEETINRLRSDKVAVKEPDPIIELAVDAYIPDEYLPDPRYKMEIYRRLAELEYKDKDDLMDEIIDRFGVPPVEVDNLWRVAAIRGLCRTVRIRGIQVRQGVMRFTFGEKSEISPEAILEVMNKYRGRMNYINGREPQLVFKFNGLKLEPLDWLEEYLPFMALGAKYKTHK